MNEEDISKLIEHLDNDSQEIIGLDSQEFLANPYLCHNCQTWIRKGKIPCVHFSNGLELDEITEDLKNILRYFSFSYPIQSIKP